MDGYISSPGDKGKRLITWYTGSTIEASICIDTHRVLNAASVVHLALVDIVAHLRIVKLVVFAEARPDVAEQRSRDQLPWTHCCLCSPEDTVHTWWGKHWRKLGLEVCRTWILEWDCSRWRQRHTGRQGRTHQDRCTKSRSRSTPRGRPRTCSTAASLCCSTQRLWSRELALFGKHRVHSWFRHLDIPKNTTICSHLLRLFSHTWGQGPHL